MTLTQKKEARLEEWRGWIKAFLEFINDGNAKIELTTIPYAAELLNDFYWRLTKDFLKPLLDSSITGEHNLHYYKIISTSELTVMSVSPITFIENGNDEVRKKINAEFAWFVGISIMLNWKIDGNVINEYDQLEKIFNHHELIDYDKNGKELRYKLDFKDEVTIQVKDSNGISKV